MLVLPETHLTSQFDETSAKRNLFLDENENCSSERLKALGRLHRLAESIPGLLKSLQIRALVYSSSVLGIEYKYSTCSHLAIATLHLYIVSHCPREIGAFVHCVGNKFLTVIFI